MTRIGSLIILFWLAPVWAAKVQVQATVDRNQASVGEALVLTIRVTSDQSINASEPKLPQLPGFQLGNSWAGSESRSTFTNGTFQVEQSRTFNYELIPTKEGKLKIGEAEIDIDGRNLKTEPISVAVSPSVQGPNVAQGGGRGRPQAQPQANDDEGDPFGDMEALFNQLIQRRALKQLPRGNAQQEMNPNDAFFIDSEVDKTSAYVGEQITANWYLYTRGMIRDIDTLKYPSLTGFWKEEIELATRLNFESHVVNGLAYKRALLASYALFPIQEGKITIDPYKAKCTVISGDVFGFGRPYQFTKASKPITIDVKPLPAEGRPASFSGAVGEFQVEAKLSADSVAVNQPVTLKIRFAGFGNAKLIDLPPLNLPAGIELYDTKKDAKFFRDGKSFKDFEVLLIPRQVGAVQIPPVAVSFFNPRTGRYIEEKTNSLSLTVIPGSAGDSVASVPLATDAADKPKAIEMPGPFFSIDSKSPVGSGWTSLLWIFLFLTALAIVLWTWAVELGWRGGRDSLQVKLKRRLKGVRAAAGAGDYRRAGVLATNLIYFVVGDLVGRRGTSRDLEALLSEGPPSLRRELGEPLKRILGQAEALAFAPEHFVTELQSKSQLKSFVDEVESTLEKATKLSEGS